MAKLLEKADVFIENLAPGAADRLGLSAASLQERYPRLVVCSVSGYGSSGPYASKKAYSLLVQSELGLISLTGTEEHPSKVGISVADISAGMYAYAGILTALLWRTSTGRGTVVRVSLLDALAEWMSAPFTTARIAASRRSGVARIMPRSRRWALRHRRRRHRLPGDSERAGVDALLRDRARTAGIGRG